MAAITPDSIEQTQTGDGERLLKAKFTSTTVSNADTWATGLSGLTEVAWKATNSTDQVGATESSGTVTFNAPAGNHNGELWLVGADY